jgi:hypothetical protein
MAQRTTRLPEHNRFASLMQQFRNLSLWSSTMLPPVLEIYVVWHPADSRGEELAGAILAHFHGTPFTGLIGGAIEVFVRTEGWKDDIDAPRPIPFSPGDLPEGMHQSAFVAIVPLLGNEMASRLEANESAWSGYIEAIATARLKEPERVFIFPYQLDPGVLDGTKLGQLLGKLQQIAPAPPKADSEDATDQICRDLAQGITQLLSAGFDDKLKVFISHTKRARPGDEEDTEGIVELVRNVIATTRLQEFFDANDLQPGNDFDKGLLDNAARSALLAIRTDLYPTREWCQREIRIAKQSGMPVVIMDAPGEGEERGSFLMDHVPRVPVAKSNDHWSKRDVYRALNLLVDECLKRALWIHQEKLARATAGGVEVSWWAPHAPEPLTLIDWLRNRSAKPDERDLIVLHPDPPLGPDEKLILDQMFALTGLTGKLDIMTPRLLAARGG